MNINPTHISPNCLKKETDSHDRNTLFQHFMYLMIIWYNFALAICNSVELWNLRLLATKEWLFPTISLLLPQQHWPSSLHTVTKAPNRKYANVKILHNGQGEHRHTRDGKKTTTASRSGRPRRRCPGSCRWPTWTSPCGSWCTPAGATCQAGNGKD